MGKRLSVGARSEFFWSAPLLLLFAVAPARGQDATWLASPANGNFSNGANWSTGTTSTGTATFDSSNQTSVTFNSSVSFDAMQFGAVAPAYTFTIGGFRVVELNGTGIVNNSSNAPTINANLAYLYFNNSASAGNAIINNNGAVSFLNTSTAGSSTITTELGFTLSFSDNSTAGNATIIVNDNGLAQFVTNGDGGNAQLIVNGIGGVIDFAFTTGRDNDNKTHAGSIAGDGGLILGNGQEFIVGSNNLSTTFSGTITECGCGLASLTKIGTGTLTLSGTNSYSGGTTFEGGTLSVSSEDNLGALTGGLTFNGGTLQITGTGFTSTARTIAWGAGGGGFDIANAANAFTVSQALAGAGGLSKLGAGALVLSGANTYSGATAVDAGTLRAGAASVFSGNSAFAVASGATLDLNNFNQTIGSLAGAGNVTLGSATLTAGGQNTSTEFSGVMSGNGGLTKSGTGVLLLSGINTYTGATTVNGGTLRAGAANVFSSGTAFTVASGATFDLNNLNQTIGSLAGAGSVALGAATLTAGGQNTSTNFSGVLSGSGGLTKVGTGALVLSGANTYSGATAVDAGTLRAGAANVFSGNSAFSVASGATLDLNNFNQTIGSLSGAGSVALGSATLTAGGQNTSTEFSGVMSGSGGLTKSGTGTLTLSGINLYTGATAVDDGTLSVNGSIHTSSGLTVNAGATLAGTGEIPTTTIAGGTLSPGNSIGTLTVGSDLTFTSSSTYRVEVAGASADRTNVDGTANLAGTVSVVASGTSFINRYTILHALTLNGTFNTLTATGLPGFLTPSLSYQGGDVFLNLSGALSGAGTLNENERQVAGAIDGYFNNNGQLPAPFMSFYSLSGSALAVALAQLTGENGTGAPSVMSQTTIQFLSLLGGDPWQAGDGAPGGALGYAEVPALSEGARAAYAAVTPRDVGRPRTGWRVWASPYGGVARTSGDSGTGSSDLDTRTYGIAAGADYRLRPDTVVGFAAAGGGEHWSVSNGSGRGDVAQFGAYARQGFGPAYLSAAAAYAWHSLHTERTVAVSGADTLAADFHAQSLAGRLEAGYRLAGVGATPYAALTAQEASLPAYTETATTGSSSSYALSYASRDVTMVRTELGARFYRRVAVGANSFLALKGRAAWAHDATSDSSVSAAFQTLPGSSFTVTGAEAPKNLALLSLGADWYINQVLSLGLMADGEFSAASRSLAGRATLRYQW